MEKEVINDAMKSFKEEQNKRKVEKIKNGFRDAVNCLSNIKDEEKELVKIFKKLGFTLSKEFRAFLETVEKYDDLVFSITSNGRIGIGTTSPDSKLFVADGENIEEVE